MRQTTDTVGNLIQRNNFVLSEDQNAGPSAATVQSDGLADSANIVAVQLIIREQQNLPYIQITSTD